MKKLILTALVASPLLTMAQIEGSGMPMIVPIVLSISFIVLMFLALRKVVLWYWKIEALSKNQERQIKSQQETNNLLSELINVYKDYNKPKDLNQDGL